MWQTSNTLTVKATPAAVWQTWEEVSKWPKQDLSLTSASINGPFQIGSQITMKPKGSPTVKVIIKQIAVNKGFTSEGKLPLTSLQFIHKIEPDGNQTKFTQTIVMDGPLSGLFSKILGKKMESNLKMRMQKTVEMLQS